MDFSICGDRPRHTGCVGSKASGHGESGKGPCGVGGMNWDKVRREKPMIEHYDYSAMMDARERGVSLDGGDVGERMAERRERLGIGAQRHPDGPDRKSVVEGKSVSVRVDSGGRRIIKKKKNNNS